MWFWGGLRPPRQVWEAGSLIGSKRLWVWRHGGGGPGGSLGFFQLKEEGARGLQCVGVSRGCSTHS